MNGYRMVVSRERGPGGPRTRYHRIVSVTGPLHLIQEFANTLGGSPATDQLGSREEAAAWLRAAGLLPAEAGLSNSEHAALVRLRDSIRDVLDAHTRGREDGDAAARLTKALADGRLVLTVDAASAVQLASAARSSYPNLVADIAVAIARSSASGGWPRLKACSAPQCGQPFYDESESAAGRHCPAHAGSS
jgi:predicted RNA-binding Zn ribbon-like protein